jgi:hypothetical protein
VPHTILEGVPVLWHVAGERFGTDGKVDARPLQKRHSYYSKLKFPKPAILVGSR